MNITSDDVKTIVAVVASITSFLALWVSWWLWRQTNRPIVTAEIKTSGTPGNVATFYELVIYNCGTRPAVNIRLTASSAALDAVTAPGAPSHFKSEIRRCFSIEHQIGLLHHGDRRRNGFGLTSTIESDNALIHLASLPIEIAYEDLMGRKYKSVMTLVVKDSEYFAGSGWGTQP